MVLIALLQMRDDDFSFGAWLFTGIVIAVWLGTPFIISWPWWFIAKYEINDHEVSMQRGLLVRRSRTIQRDRIQSVNINANVLSRLLGQAEVIIEAAGDADSNIRLRYVTLGEANAIRWNLRGEAPEAATVDGAPEGLQDRDEVANHSQSSTQGIQITQNRNVALGYTLRYLLAIIFVIVLAFIIKGFAIAVALPIALQAINALDKVLNLELDVDNKISIRSGMLNKHQQSFERTKIQTVVLKRPVLWCWLDWWEVSVSILGEDEIDTKVIASAVSRKEAETLLFQLVGDVDLETKKLRSPAQTWWVSPIDYKQQSVSFYEDLVVVHRGRLGRKIQVAYWRDLQAIRVKNSLFLQVLGISRVVICKPTLIANIILPELREREANTLVVGLRATYLPHNQAVAMPHKLQSKQHSPN